MAGFYSTTEIESVPEEALQKGLWHRERNKMKCSEA